MTSNSESPEALISKRLQISIDAPLLSGGGSVASTFHLEVGKIFVVRHVAESGTCKTYEMSVNANGMGFKIIKAI